MKQNREVQFLDIQNYQINKHLELIWYLDVDYPTKIIPCLCILWYINIRRYLQKSLLTQIVTYKNLNRRERK